MDIERPAVSRTLFMLLVMPSHLNFAFIAKLDRVVQYRNATASGGTITRRLEMTGRMSAWLTQALEKEAIGCLGVRPVLPHQRNALSHGSSNLGELFAESIAEPSLNSHSAIS
ncbi:MULTISPECIES: hypothetical protein [unclassified Bradyrhizobium]|uniref:hypothetical protein n=1 Tax=Bradyrhizobium sp. IC4060 TaxID=2793807 RepID=UPI00201C054F|nr:MULTISPECIES: hypothetical protein [unclassified Bradyrhizobium]